MKIISAIIFGVVFFAAGVGVNMLHDKLIIRKNVDGSFDGRYSRGCLLGKLLKAIGVIGAIIMIIVSIFIA